MNPPTNPPSSTADAVLAEVADPLDAILRQIVGGYFVLTDGQGSVSKWSEPAELLFGRPAEEILGQSFFETLIGGTIPPAGQAWRAFLDHGEPPQVPGSVTLTGRRTDGDDFEMEAVFVPVKLDEGFDFSLFLEDLSFELPLNLMLLRMRQQHPVVVRALRAAIEPEVQPWEGWRTAGTLVVFRPLQATPWVEAELARRQAEREAADAEAEERITNIDPGIQGDFRDLDDAAAVVARLLSAVERIDELERVAGGLPAQLEEARRDAERRAADFDALRADVQRALSNVPSELDRVEQLARLERLERARQDGEAVEAERRQALAAAEAATARLAARLDQLERDRGAADTRLAEEIEARTAEAIAETARRLESRLAPDVSGRLAELEREREAIRAELEQLRAGGEDGRVAELQAQLQALQETVERHEAGAHEWAAVREAVAHHEALVADGIAHHEALANIVAGLSERVAASGPPEELAQLRERHEAAIADLAALREAVERQEAATAELAALRDQLSTDATAAELAELREAVARHEAASSQIASLTAVVAHHEALTEGFAQLRAEVSALPEEIAELRRQVAERPAVQQEADPEAVERHVQTLVGDTQQQIAALHARLAALGDTVVAREELQQQLDARSEDVAALHARIDALPVRDELAGREDISALHERIDAVRGELAGRDDIAALHERIDTVRDERAGRDELAALHERIDLVPGRDEVASRDEVAELRERLEGLAGRDELAALRERLDAGVAEEALTAAREALERVDQVDRGAGTVLADVRALREVVDGLSQGSDSGELREAVARLTGEFQAVRDEGRSLGERVDAVDQRAAALRTELGAGRERLDALGAHIDRIGATVLETGEAVDAANERTAALRTELSEVRHVAETAARGLDVLRAELAGFRELAEGVRADAAAARTAADERIEAMQSELTFALKSLDELKQGLSSAGQAAVIARREAEQARKAAQHVGDGSTERVTEVFQQILGLAAARNQPNRRTQPATPLAPKAEPEKREPRHGFDDATTPMAILGLDGKFRQLNPAFAKLVGYKEHEFTKAAWPSPHDRRDYKAQLEQLRKLGIGELHEVEVQSTYMHGQGLMVPVVGKLTVELGEDGRPQHLLLEAEDRHTG